MRMGLTVLLLVVLAGCSGGRHEDLEQFIKTSGDGLSGRVDRLPQVKPYEPFVYAASDLPDPFKPRKLSNKGGGANQPDLNRPKELLEAFPLEKLKMVGTVEKKGVIEALIMTPDNGVFRVKKGDRIGQNYGVVVNITETGISLAETVQDIGGDWAERPTALQLAEDAEPQKPEQKPELKK